MYSQIISALSNMLSEIFKFKTTQITNQSETAILNDKKDYKTASNIAEKIIKISTKYKPIMTFSDKLRFSKLVTKFEKYN